VYFRVRTRITARIGYRGGTTILIDATNAGQSGQSPRVWRQVLTFLRQHCEREDPRGEENELNRQVHSIRLLYVRAR